MVLVIVHVVASHVFLIRLKAEHRDIWQKYNEPSLWISGPAEFVFEWKFLLRGEFREHNLAPSVHQLAEAKWWLYILMPILFMLWQFT